MNLTAYLKTAVCAIALLCAAATAHAARTSASPTIAGGSYYGTNYTVPFAHAYRALGELGVDRREAIDRDTYHFARLGMNAFRLHLWDVELTDAHGNLLDKDNEHLELLDYLIARLEQRGIAIVLTAQTNFGNGYPERNTDPNGAYSYDYPKCEVHDNPAAQAAQANYLDALVRHVNPFTGKSYAEDPDIIAIEINNEPCHSGTHAEITAYIDRMAETLRAAGWDKEILYNVSHNLWRTQAFYDAIIDGTTYQWYPTGLVRGSARKGNFLPVLDSYNIPFDSVRGYSRPSKVIYEYDPADVLDTYLYPAAARTFRKAGFAWITQFAYDPIDMARHNTEYQTHFLNLAYTPGKAIGMLIAAEATRRIPEGKDFGKYPADTVFGDFLVSARRNLAMLNDGTSYYHTNTTGDAPKNIRKLRHIAGVGSSPLISTDGTGAYFLDALGSGKGQVWRLEIMPDVLLTGDPFARPSLKRSVGETLDCDVTLDVSALLGKDFAYCTPGGAGEGRSTDGRLTLKPGVYLLGPDATKLKEIDPEANFGPRDNMRVGEYVAPAHKDFRGSLVHEAPVSVPAGAPLTLTAIWVGNSAPDSIVVYPADANFWNDHNALYRMEAVGKHTFSVTIDAEDALNGKKDGRFAYRIVAFDRDGNTLTYPGRAEGTPLSWDYGATDQSAAEALYFTDFIPEGQSLTLLSARENLDGSELSTIPEAWRGVSWTYSAPSADAVPALRLVKDANAATDTLVVSKYVASMVAARGSADMNARKRLALRFGENKGSGHLKVGLVNRDGFTYSANVKVPTGGGLVELPLEAFTLDETLLTPAPYPSFLSHRFVPDPTTATPLRPSEIETVTLVLISPPGEEAALEVRSMEIL